MSADEAGTPNPLKPVHPIEINILFNKNLQNAHLLHQCFNLKHINQQKTLQLNQNTNAKCDVHVTVHRDKLL